MRAKARVFEKFSKICFGFLYPESVSGLAAESTWQLMKEFVYALLRMKTYLISLFLAELMLFAQKIRICLFLLIAFGCTCTPRHSENVANQTDVKKILSSLSSDERFLLEFFFRCLIQDDAVGYVLLGGKPMSFYSQIMPKIVITSPRIQPLDRMGLLFDSINDSHALFRKGLEIWKKYEHHFCGKNIFFDVFEQDRELRFMQVSVFNKRLMLPFLNRYFHMFINLNYSIKDKESLFNLLLHDQRFKEKFYSKQDLLGVCLGYGEKNAALFQKMVNLLTSMGKLDFTLERPSPDRLKSLEDEFAVLERFFNGRIRDHTTRKFLFNIGLSFRASFSDPETIFLQKKYAELHKKLAQMYEGAVFLEKTLELICIADNAVF